MAMLRPYPLTNTANPVTQREGQRDRGSLSDLLEEMQDSLIDDSASIVALIVKLIARRTALTDLRLVQIRDESANILRSAASVFKVPKQFCWPKNNTVPEELSDAEMTDWDNDTIQAMGDMEPWQRHQTEIDNTDTAYARCLYRCAALIALLTVEFCEKVDEIYWDKLGLVGTLKGVQKRVTTFTSSYQNALRQLQVAVSRFESFTQFDSAKVRNTAAHASSKLNVLSKFPGEEEETANPLGGKEVSNSHETENESDSYDGDLDPPSPIPSFRENHDHRRVLTPARSNKIPHSLVDSSDNKSREVATNESPEAASDIDTLVNTPQSQRFHLPTEAHISQTVSEDTASEDDTFVAEALPLRQTPPRRLSASPSRMDDVSLSPMSPTQPQVFTPPMFRTDIFSSPPTPGSLLASSSPIPLRWPTLSPTSPPEPRTHQMKLAQTTHTTPIIPIFEEVDDTIGATVARYPTHPPENE